MAQVNIIADFLENIQISFPQFAHSFPGQFLQLLGLLGEVQHDHLALTPSDLNFHPGITLDFGSSHLVVTTHFTISSGKMLSVRVENTTGQERASPHSYTHLALDRVTNRLEHAGIRLAGLDHVGFNLPWFGPGIHPQIERLRQELAGACLYHRFPSGEPWDFILPGDQEEICRCRTVDYTKTRRPKFEMVSFDKASTPLIQFDLQVNASYEVLCELFPETLMDPELRNLWIYLQNPYGLDVCLVANETGEGDWSGFFAGFRIDS